MTIEYDAGSLTGWCGLPCLLLRWKGTVCQGAVFGPMFWLTLLTHVAFLVLGGEIPVYLPPRNGTDSNAPWVLWEPIALPSLDYRASIIGLSLLFFFIVFYNNNAYSRFYQLYSHCVGIGAATMEWVTLVKANTQPLSEQPESAAAARWNAVRFPLAAMHVLYYTLHGEGLSEGEWAVVVERNLLGKEELEELKVYAGFKPMLCLAWGLDEARALLTEMEAFQKKALPMRDELILQQFRDVAFRFRGHCGQITNLLKQPVPFPYFHLLNVILLFQLLFLSYSLATFDGLELYFSLPLMAFVTVVLLGMRGLAVQLSNPFGNDAVDFPIEQFMKGAYTNAVAHLRSRDRPACTFKLPGARMRNPLALDLSGEDESAIQQAWARGPTDVGRIKDDDRVFDAEFEAAATEFATSAVRSITGGLTKISPLSSRRPASSFLQNLDPSPARPAQAAPVGPVEYSDGGDKIEGHMGLLEQGPPAPAPQAQPLPRPPPTSRCVVTPATCGGRQQYLAQQHPRLRHQQHQHQPAMGATARNYHL